MTSLLKRIVLEYLQVYTMSAICFTESDEVRRAVWVNARLAPAWLLLKLPDVSRGSIHYTTLFPCV
jgi:hypothetical protein